MLMLEIYHIVAILTSEFMDNISEVWNELHARIMIYLLLCLFACKWQMVILR